MNYLEHYKHLIRKTRVRQGLCIFEAHHIIPKCLGGSNKPYNLVKLTFKEHFIAHMLLWKISQKKYGINHRYTKKMLHAVMMMVNRQTKSSRLYESARKHFSKSLTGSKHHLFGKKWKHTGQKLLRYQGENNPAVKMRKEYKITFIDGRIITILGIRKFCQEYNYRRTSIREVMYGSLPSYKDVIGVEQL